MKACEGLCNHEERSFHIQGWMNKDWKEKNQGCLGYFTKPEAKNR